MLTTRRVSLLFGDRLAHARLLEAVRGHAALWTSEDPDEVADAVATSHDEVATVILFSPSRHAEGIRAAEIIRAVAPDHAIVGYVDPRTISSRFILETGRVALTDLVLRDVDDSRAILLRVIQNAAQRDRALRIAHELCDGQPREVRLVVQFICRHLRDTLDATSIAAGLGLNRRTLYHRLAQVGSPGPRELVGWCRVAYVCWQLSHASATLADIATQLDVPVWRGLASLLRRYLNMTTRELRESDAFAIAIDRFRAQFVAPISDDATPRPMPMIGTPLPPRPPIALLTPGPLG
ncbi:MAG: AraC family transcriptional regulator [Gemmatimonadaceae bacterium]|nr:AraC family transcriptional regulator [Gemmatimonadaceae bacterium]